MARVDSLNNFLTDVADSIRTKKGTTDAILASDFDAEIESIETDPNLQNKSITITENGTQNVTADEGYDGLSDVEVITNVPTGGDIPTKGFVVNEWDSNGYPIDITVLGLTELPANYFNAIGNNNDFMSHVRKITLPSDVTKIGEKCFYNAIRINEIVNIENVPTIVQYGFYGCTSLTSIDIHNVNKLYLYTFQKCSKLREVFFSNELTVISGYCFADCTELSLTSLPDSIVAIGGGDIFNGSSTYTGYSFSNCTNLALTKLPSNLTKLYGDYNFQNCTNLALTELPSALTSIGNYTFYNCTNLALTELPSGITSIGANAFQNCTNLALTELPSALTSIGNYTFYNCTNLALTELPSALTSIGSFAFGNTTTNIKTIPETITSVGAGAFYSSSIIQISVNLSNIRGNSSSSSYRGLFENCQKMIACWVGSNIANLYRYSFNTCVSMKKLFIDKPRATVEGFVGYSYHFSNNTNTTFQIICNDDEGFMTKEEFDAIDWSTYTEEV